MSKFDSLIINDIKMLSLDMIKEAGSGNSALAINSAPVFYSLFMNHLQYDNHNESWLNQDQLLVNNNLLAVYYASKHLFGFDLPLDNLKEFKKLNSKLPGYQIASNVAGDLIGYGVGISLGERYLHSLIDYYENKSKLIDFHTYMICTWSDLVSGTAFEALSYAANEKLNKLIVIVIKEETSDNSDNIIDYLEDLDLNVINANSNNLSSINDAISDAIKSNSPSIILVDAFCDKEFKEKDLNRVLTEEELDLLKAKYKLEDHFYVNETHYQYIKKSLSKRLISKLEKWDANKNELLINEKIKQVWDFLESKDYDLNFNIDNIKINDNYEEDLLVGNNKIFNILAKKSPFILNLSNSKTCNIDSSKIMSKKTPLERNIYFEGKTLAMASIACGLGKLGFKVFVSCPLILSNIVRPFIKYSAFEEIDVHYTFTNDTFLNTYEDLGISAIDEINSFRLIPKLITFRPADINEIIGVYNILANYKKCSITIIGSGSMPKLIGTNSKYVVAGAYRVKREVGEASGIIIATGTEVKLALKIADELLPYGIDMRVVTMPSIELFSNQSDRYQYTLLPKELKTFVIEFGSTLFWHKYATSEEYILGLDRYSTSGTKEELLNKYNLDIDSIKTRIIELMKK